MKIVSSYPRSGSAWLRFIICNLYYPDQEHDFASVNHLFPSADTDREATQVPLWVKTHHLTHADVVLYRHVGDVLISQYWYNKKHDPDFAMNLSEWMFRTNYGQEWREHVNYYKDHPCKIEYNNIPRTFLIDYITRIDDLDKPSKFSRTEIKKAVEKSTFKKMQKIESKGFGVYPEGNKDIKYLRFGKSEQWRSLNDKDIELLLTKNEMELEILGYGNELL